MWAEKQAQTAESKTKRERRKNNREANSTCTRATNSRGPGPSAARLTTSILPPEGLKNSGGRTRRGTTRPNRGRENSSCPPHVLCSTPAGFTNRAGKTQPKSRTQGFEIQPRRSRATIPQQATHKTASIRVHLAWPRPSKGAWLKPGHTTRNHGWPKTPQHLATNVAECLRPGTNPICYEARR